MKLRLFAIALAIAVLVASGMALAKGGKGGGGGGGDKDSGTMSVQVKSAQVKSSPNYMGATTTTLGAGAQVNVIGEQGNWYQLSSPSGWIPKSAVTKHKVSVDADQKVAGKQSSHDEVALAGKGFDKIEIEYKSAHPELSSSFAAVDRLSNEKVSEAALRQFQKSGKLNPR